MAADPTLTATELTRLSGPTTCRAYLSVITPAVVATATLDDPGGTLTWPLFAIPTRSRSAGWANIDRGQTVIITRSGVVIGIYRVRAAGSTGTSLLIGETSKADPGLLVQDLREVFPQDGDTLTIYQRVDQFSALPYLSGGNVFEDGMTYATWVSWIGATNSAPEPQVNIGPHRHQRPDAGQTYATMTFTCTPIVWLATQVAFNYLWTVPGTWTITAGGVDQASFTARVPRGKYVLKCACQVTGTGASSMGYAYRQVTVYDPAQGDVIALTDINSDTRDRSGRRMSLGILNQVLASLPDGSLVDVIEEATWGGLDVPTATTNFTGWVAREPWILDFGITGAELEILGPADMLARLGGYSAYYKSNATPTAFEHLGPGLNNINFALWYHLRLRAPNILSCFDYFPFSNDGTKWVINAMNVATGNLLDQAQRLAAALSCNYGHDSRGAAFMRRHPSMWLSAVRAANTVTRDTLTNSQFQPPTIAREMRPRLRTLRAEGFTYWLASPNPSIGEAPGKAPGQGAASETIGGLIMDLSSEATITFAGLAYAMRNNPYPQVTIPIPKNRDVYEPAQMSRIRLQYPAARTPDNTAWDKYGVPLEIRKTHNKDGTANIEMDLEMETSGLQGEYVTVQV